MRRAAWRPCSLARRRRGCRPKGPPGRWVRPRCCTGRCGPSISLRPGPRSRTPSPPPAPGDGTDLLEEFDSYTGRNPDGSYSNIFEANAAVNCLDQPAPTIAQIQASVPAAEVASPFFGLADLYGEVECSVWPVPATGQIGPVHAVGSPPIVVVGSTGDPITLYSWAESLAAQLQHGVLLTRVGAGHTGYFASSCIRAHVDSYLITGVPPAPGTRCASD